MGSIYCGSSGWSYPDWPGLIFPVPRPRGFHPLEHLSRFVDLVEIDTSFHGALRPEISKLWVHKVAHNPAFQFTARLWRRFGFDRDLTEDAVKAFRDGLWPLAQAGRLGCLLMEFPWAFRFTRENRDFLIRLRRTFHEFRLVAELRHNSWLVDEAQGTLIDYHVGFANIDQPQWLRATPPTAILTSPTGYVRLHGRASTTSVSEIGCSQLLVAENDYMYSLDELSQWKSRIERIVANATVTFVVMTNHGGGRSIVNALQLKKLIGEKECAGAPAPRVFVAA